MGRTGSSPWNSSTGSTFSRIVLASANSLNESATEPALDALSSFRKDLPRTDAIASPGAEKPTESLNELTTEPAFEALQSSPKDLPRTDAIASPWRKNRPSRSTS